MMKRTYRRFYMDDNAKLTGLTSAHANELLKQFGPNVIEPPKTSFFKKMLRWLVSPMSALLLAASWLSFYSGKTFDGWFILVLFVMNFVIAQWHESKADNAIATLQKKLTVSVQTKRDGKWQLLDSAQLVPGDVVKLVVGNLVPADIQIAEAENLQINESVLTGESLPVGKGLGQLAYTGSFITTGGLAGLVKATGEQTKFGKTTLLVDNRPKNSLLERDILTISKYLMIVALLAAAVITIFLWHSQTLTDLLTLDLSVLIAGVPVAMPVVMSLIISLGVVRLTKKHVIVRRLSSLEDLANVDLLLSDKTGTLTKNEIVVERIIGYGGASEAQIIRLAISATTDNQLDPLNQAILARGKAANVKAFKQLKFTPADSKRKRSTAIVEVGDGKQTIALGASQIIQTLCHSDPKLTKQFNLDVEQAAASGYRVLALAVGNGEAEKDLQLVGLLLLSDSLRPDAKAVIEFLKQHGVETKMMTGDNRSIATRVAASLGLQGRVMAAAGRSASITLKQLDDTSVFAEVLPEDKFRIVSLSAQHYTAAATGDGVNDLPALEKADVGIAVSNAVDALKSAADIVLLTSGIGVIRDAIIEARKIFMRTYYYSVYRISESFRLILSIAILSLIYGSFPITPIQIILLALLNDLPIISLAYDRVEPSAKPEVIHVKERFMLASLFGTIGVFTSLSLFWVLHSSLHLDTAVIQTMFFLKLAVSGHMLIYVAHTKRAWWRWLPAKQIIWATSLTQLAATALALSGILFQRISLPQALLVWAWAFGWMQIAELAKQIFIRNVKTSLTD